MPTERQAPDAILVQSALEGVVADIQDDPDDPDENWLTQDGSNSNTDCRVSFPTPTGNPTTGAGFQEFRVLIRKNESGGNAATWSLALWEGGSQVGELANGDVTTTTGEVVSATWNASSLGTADGSQVECRLEQTGGGSGGPAANRRRVEIGAVEWNVTYDEGATEKSGSDTISLSVSEIGEVDAEIAGTDTASLSVSESGSIEADAASADTVTLSTAETGGVEAEVTSSDTATLSTSESADVEQTLDVGGSDTLTLAASETAALEAELGSADTASLSTSEAAALETALSSADTVVLSTSESASVDQAQEVNSSDTLTLSTSESGSAAPGGGPGWEWWQAAASDDGM